MDRHHLLHRHNHLHHQNNPDPRYIPLRPHHQHQSSLFRPPPLPPQPHGHLRPPPPQQPLPPPPPQQPPLRPPPPCFVHNPPHSRRHEGNFVDSSHHHQPRRPEGNFVTSLSHHHHHHHPQPHRHPPRVVFDDDRNRFRLTDPDRVSDLDMDLDRCGPVPVRRPINFDRTVEIDDEDRFRSSRFREDLSFENPNSSRFYPVDEVQGRIDDRRVVEIDDQHYRHEQYLPDVLLSEFELNPGVNQCVGRGPRVDEVPIKVSRDEVNARRGVQPRSRDESHLPVKFRNRGIDIDDGFYEKGMNSPGSESGRYVDRGRREEIQDYSRSSTSGSSLRKNLQKKSAFLRIQPLKHTPNSSSRSSRFDTTPSPHKGKGKDKDKDKDKESLEYLDHKSSQDRGVSPVELDVSFKSNALVAKAIVGNLSTSPTDYNVNSDASDLNGARIGGSESPLKKEIVKKCEKNPSLSSKVEKGSEKKVIRFAMKRVGPSNNADSSKSSVDRGSLKVEGQHSDKGDKLSAPNARKRKKSFVWPSRLSGTVPAKTNAESLDKDKSQNQPSSSCVSEKCIKKSDKEVSSDDQVVGSADKETIELTVKFDLNECPSGLEDGAVGHSDSDSSCPKKSRNRGSSYEPKDGLENLNGIGEEVQKTSGSDEVFIKSIEKCSSDIGTGCNSSKDQDIVPLLVDCGSGEGSPEPVACLEGHLDSIDVDCGEVNMHNSVAVANATSSPLDVSNGAQLRIEETCTHDNHCETKVVLSSDVNVVDIPFDGLHLDVGNIQSESSKSEELTNLAKVSNINVDGHKTNTTVSDGLVSVDSEILTTSSDINPTNDTEHQECQGAGTTSAVGEAREEPSRAIDLLQCSSPSFSLEKDVSLPNRKRKVACKLDSLGSGVPASSCDRAVNVPVKDLDSVEKMSSAVSSSPCVIAESNVLHSNELTENPLGSMSLMNHGCDSDPIECYSSCSKKQKILSFEPVSSDALPSEKCDIPAPADTSVSMIEIPMNSCLSAVVIGLPNCLHTNKNVTGEGSDNLLTCKFVDNSKADFLRGESSLPVEENAHLNDKQSSFYSEPSKHQDIMNANMSEFGNGIRSVAVESESRIATDHPNGSVPYLRPELSRDSDNKTPVIDMECENNIISNDVSPSLSDSSQLCAESASDGLTGNSNMMETPGNVGSAGAGCLGAPTVDTSEIVSAVNALTEIKGSIDDKGSSSMPSSLSNSLVECNEINLKPGVSASKSDKPFVPKTLLVPSKKANNLISSSNVLSRQHVGRNSYTGHASSVMTTSTKAPSTYPTKPRTWRRSDNAPASNTLVKKSSVSPAPQQRPPIDRTVKFRGNSYIRKGNSLVRNPVSNAASLGPHVSKPNETNKIDKVGSSGVIDSTVVHDTPSTMGQNTSIEMPKTPPLSCSDNASNSDVLPSEDCPFSPPVVSEGVGNEEALRSSESALHFSRNSTTVEHRHVEDAGALSDGNLPGTSGKRVVYIKRKSHQLIAATNSPDLSLSNADMTPTLSSDISYYKRRKNQLIRASSESNIHQMVAAIDDSSSSQPQKASRSYMSKSSTKRPSNKVKPAKVSLVWKLGDRNSSVKGADLLGRGKLLSHLLPWKRATNWRSVWWSSGNMPNGSSLKTKIVGQKFLSSRKRTIVYMRSGRGFSLRRSKVVSVAGSSLKWSKSMERRSKKVDEEVSKAVAAARKTIGASNDRAESTHHPSHKPGERIFRIGVYRYRMDPSRRTLHRIPDEESADSLASLPAKDVRKTYVPKRLLIGSDEYVRIGNGNQLVRDPKRRTRILASEKIRWSLHTARTRLAKKRKFCQFFTRFGKCNKGEGKCHFIHDPSKIAVCTKFLNGLCSDPNCKLTHKVIPERMPDCSFFLQGLCSNENCPYRHVNVNPKASICESFLRGYCADGNECRKKHSYSCPEYESTGSCPQGSRCKLYHPKKGKSQKRKGSKDQRNSRRRYFGSVFTTTTQPETVTEKLPVAPKNDSSDCPGGNLGDFISLDVSDDEVEDSRDGTTFTAMDMSEGRSSKSQLDDDDVDVELITPFRLLDRH